MQRSRRRARERRSRAHFGSRVHDGFGARRRSRTARRLARRWARLGRSGRRRAPACRSDRASTVPRVDATTAARTERAASDPALKRRGRCWLAAGLGALVRFLVRPSRALMPPLGTGSSPEQKAEGKAEYDRRNEPDYEVVTVFGHGRTEQLSAVPAGLPRAEG